MSTSPPASDPGWFARAFNLIRGVGGNIVDLARLVLSGQATPSQIVFFAIGLLGLACIASFPLFAIRGDTTLLFVTFAVLAIVVLVLVSLMAWRMAPPAPRSADEGLLALAADLTQARGERDRANDQLAARTTELITTNDNLTIRTNELAVETERSRVLTQELQDVQTEIRALTVQRDRSRDWLRELYSRCEQIYLQIRNAPPKYPRVFSEVSVFTIDDDGTMTAEQTIKLQPTGGKLQMILRELGSDVSAGPVQELEIALQATLQARGNQQVVMLPASDEDKEKKFLLVFLPEISNNAKLEYTFGWRWAKFWHRLLKDGKDCWEVTLHSSDTIPQVKFQFRLSPQLAAQLLGFQVANIGAGGGRAENPFIDASGYTVYGWTALNVPHDTTMKIFLSCGNNLS